MSCMAMKISPQDWVTRRMYLDNVNEGHVERNLAMDCEDSMPLASVIVCFNYPIPFQLVACL